PSRRDSQGFDGSRQASWRDVLWDRRDVPWDRRDVPWDRRDVPWDRRDVPWDQRALDQRRKGPSMTALVTGAAGFVGRSVVDDLLRRGETVRALVRQPSQADELTALGAEGVVGDVRSLQEVAEAARG